MPKYKSELGQRPPTLLTPRGRATTLLCNFDPTTLQRDCPTPFKVGQERLARQWLRRRWEEALKRATAEAKATASGEGLAPPLEDCLARALQRGICLQSERRLSPKTMDAYEDAVDLFLRWLAHHRPSLSPWRISDIDRDMITEYVGYRTVHSTDRVDGQSRPPPTERAMYRQVQGIKWAIIRGAPLHQVQDSHYEIMPKHISGKSQPRSIYLTGDQMQKYFQAIRDLGHTGLLAMAICEALLGMRRGDAKGLTAKSFKQDDGFRYVLITEASKGRPRPVVLIEEVYDIVDGYVIPALPIKLPWVHEEDSIYHPLRKAAKKAGVPYASPNDLRASFSVLLLNAGIPHATVAEMMGTSVQMLKSHYDRAVAVNSSLRRQRIRLENARQKGRFSELLPDITEPNELEGKVR